MSRRTLMSPQEHKTSRYTPNKLEMKSDSAALAPAVTKRSVHIALSSLKDIAEVSLVTRQES